MMSLRGNLDVLTSLSTKNGVCAPVGGFANHVRWLALLDPVYQFELTPLVIPKYRNTLDHSRNLKFLDADSKLNSIKKLIYNESRSWNNWLAQEWLYREELNDVMRVEHVVAGHDVQKWIVLTINPNLALRCYFKMHSNLNNLTPDQFKQSIVDHNSGTEKSNSPNFRDTRKNLNAPAYS